MGGRTREIKLSSITFSKAGDATLLFRSMLGSYKNGQHVSKADSIHLQALLERHDEQDEKIGSGISHFYVYDAPDDQFTRCFWICRTDHTRVAFSYMHCLKKKPYD